MKFNLTLIGAFSLCNHQVSLKGAVHTNCHYLFNLMSVQGTFLGEYPGHYFHNDEVVKLQKKKKSQKSIIKVS